MTQLAPPPAGLPDRERPPAGAVAPRPARRLSRRALAGVATALLVLPPAAAAGLSALQAPTYAAQVDVLYAGSDTTTSQSIERELATQQVLLESRPLIAEAARAVHLPAEAVAAAVSVEVVAQSNVLRLHVEDTDADRARAVARSLVDQYLAAVEEQATAASPASREQDLLEGEVDRVTGQLDDVTGRLAELAALPTPTPAQQAEQRSLQDQEPLLRQQLSELQSQLVSVRLQLAQASAGRAQILAEPSVPAEPVAPQPLRAAAGGGLAGLVLAVGLLALLRSRQTRGTPGA